MFEAFVASLSSGLILGLFALAVVLTLASEGLVAVLWRKRGQEGRWRLSLGAVLASLIWIALLFAAGVIAARYFERLEGPLAGYAVFFFVAGLVSLGRAALYRRVQEGAGPWPGRDWRQWLQRQAPWMAPMVMYLLWATVLYWIWSLLAGHWVEGGLLLPLYFGALLPDLDSPDVGLGHLLAPISRRFESRFDVKGSGHGQVLHTPLAAVLVALIALPLIPLVGWQSWALLDLGYVSHLLLDLLRPEGLMLLWPFDQRRYRLLGALGAPGGLSEGRLALGLCVVAIALLFFVDIGQPPPAPVATPTYEQSLERYYDLRGRNLIFADVEGTWQATRRRISDRYEILNGAGETLIMLDRYTGRVFSAGRGADDNLYLNRLAVQAGAPAQIKGVELHLEDQALLDALPILYEMEREPGLEHIFVSGDVFLLPQEDDGTILRPDYAQTSLRKVITHDPGHYSLHYLTAAELIALGKLPVREADLVIVATYTTVPTGPTPTPLPRVPEVGS
jgi:membrane-bound metal-dependent hydrolase YbcI (DUF457 family)